MIEPSSLVGGGPIGRSVAPPGVELLLDGNTPPHRIDPGSRLLDPPELFDFDRRMADDRQECLVIPNVGLQRRNIQIADQNSASRGQM